MAKEMILGVCSTGSRLKLAVFDGKKLCCAQRRAFNQEKPLFPMINRLLKGAGLGAVGIFCAVRGPGRFTGVRIGLTLGRVLEALAGAKIYSATLFEIMALQAFENAAFKSWAERRRNPRIAVLMRAFKDEYFCQIFDAGAGLKCPVAAFEPQWLKAPEMKEYLSAFGPELFVIGDAEEDPSVYNLAPAYCVKAGPGISKIIPVYLIKTALVLKNRNASPLYLKPARYELEAGK
jgi:tRNA A37 threonylcarbamoyladenosine modification protein TsaB